MIYRIIKEWASTIEEVNGKVGKSFLQPSLSQYLEQHGYVVDQEDTRQFLKPGISVWRNKKNCSIAPTQKQRRIDIVVYKDNIPVALIETESDLKHLRKNGFSDSKKRYDVYSIAKGSNGKYFNSYKSLERMATAAFLYHLFQVNRLYPNNDEAMEKLEAISSDSPDIHNPGGMELYLVTGSCRPKDREILRERLSSTNAVLISILEN